MGNRVSYVPRTWYMGVIAHRCGEGAAVRDGSRERGGGYLLKMGQECQDGSPRISALWR